MALYRVAVDLTWAYAKGSPGANVWHLRSGENIADPADVESLMGKLEDFYTGISSNISSGLTCTFNGEVFGVGPQAGEVLTIDPWTVTGAGSSAHLSTALALVIGWKTASGGRKGRGRTFVGPLSAGMAEADGEPAGFAITAVQNRALDLIASFDGALTGAFGVYSQTDGLFRDFTGAKVRDTFGILRSRRD